MNSIEWEIVLKFIFVSSKNLRLKWNFMTGNSYPKSHFLKKFILQNLIT